MTTDQANAAIKWFAQLFPAMTAQQGVELRDSILPFTRESFDAAAREAFGRLAFVSDAIVAVLARLHSTTSARSTEAKNARLRTEHKTLQAGDAEDDAVCRGLSDEEFKEHAEAVLERIREAGVVELYRHRGLRRCRAVRRGVAERVRMLGEVASGA